MANTQETTTLATRPQGYAVLAANDFMTAIQEELDGLDLTFEKIKIPAGGSTVFEVPGENGEPDAVKEFTGVILYNHPMFMYYSSKYAGGNNPPDCGSMDGRNGTGNPGGACAKCPKNQYGTGENNAKACKNRRRLFILLEGELFPVILSIPTASLGNFSKFLQKQLSKGLKPWQYVTRFSLAKDTNSGGIVYSKAQFAKDRNLSPEELEAVGAFAEQIKAYSQSLGYEIDPQDFAVDEATGEVIEPLGGGARV